MKVIKGLLVTLLIGLTVFHANAEESKFGPFESFVALFSDSTAFAIIESNNGDSILFVSNETFYDVDSLNHPTHKEAIAAQIYGLDSLGKIVCYGEVRSQGTAYPISISKDKDIMLAGHHFIRRYTLKGNPMSLELAETADVTFRFTKKNKTKASYAYENRESNIYYEDARDKKDFDKMVKEFEESKAVIFEGK